MARKMLPYHEQALKWNEENHGRYDDWCDSKYVTVLFIGVAHESVELGNVLSSYNAG